MEDRVSGGAEMRPQKRIMEEFIIGEMGGEVNRAGGERRKNTMVNGQ